MSPFVTSRAAQPDFDKYAARSKLDRPKALAQAQQDLVELRKNRRLTSDQRDSAIKELEARIKDIQNPLRPFYADADFYLYAAKVGDIGWFDKWSRGKGVLSTEAFQVIDDKDVIANFSLTTGEKLMWIAGIDTSGLQDGRPMKLNGLFAVTGNRTYTTAAGSNTALVLERIDPKEQEEKFTRQDELRKWTDKTGRYSIVAIYAGYEHGSVKLMKLDATTKDVRLTDLSESDQKYVRTQLQIANEMERQVKRENANSMRRSR